MRYAIHILTITATVFLLLSGPAVASVPDDCELPDDTMADIRLLLTAEDNGPFFELWTHEELACAAIDIYYNDPEDAGYHDRVVAGAVVLLGMTEDPRAVPVLIDAIDTHAPQALYALGNFPTVESLHALVSHIQDADVSARENAAEGLRRMWSPQPDAMPDGWSEALEEAIEEVETWIEEEPEWDVVEYFEDALENLEELLESAEVVPSGEE